MNTTCMLSKVSRSDPCSMLLQARVLAAVHADGWLLGGLNQAMCFGNLPSWAVELGSRLPVHLLAQKAGTRCGSKYHTLCSLY